MTGKVFNNTTNIYQDQAKVLFDYYKSAAEKIVSEEIAAENDEQDVENRIRETEHKVKTTKILFPIFLGVTVAFVIGGFFAWPMFIFAIVGLIFGIKFLVDNRRAVGTLKYLGNLLEEIRERFKNIRRDYSVEALGVVYVPIATRVPFEEKNFLIDHTEVTEDTNFKLNVLHQPEEFQNAVKELQDSMEGMPVIDNNETTEEVNTSDYSTSVQNIVLHDYIGSIDRQVRNVSYLLGDSDDVSVSIPVIMPESEQAQFIREYATTDTADKPVIRVFDVDFEDKISKFASLNALKDQLKYSDEADSAEYMKRLMQRLAESVQIICKTKNASASRLVEYTSGIFANVMKAGFIQYSPALEAEEIERIRTTDFNYQTAVNDYSPFSLKKSSRVKYDMFSGNWVAEDGSRTSMPFGMHQIDEEIFMPVISAIMEENRLERLKIYNNIEDQKREYLEKWSSETGNYFRDNRKSADELITHMRESYSEYISAFNMYKSLQETSGSMKASRNIEDGEVKEIDAQDEIIAGFETQAAQCNAQQQLFRDFMDRIQESISESTNGFAHVEYYEGSLRDSMSHDTAVALSGIHSLNERQRNLLSISPYLAKFAKLPPSPSISEQMMEHLNIDLKQQALVNVDIR